MAERFGDKMERLQREAGQRRLARREARRNKNKKPLMNIYDTRTVREYLKTSSGGTKRSRRAK